MQLHGLSELAPKSGLSEEDPLIQLATSSGPSKLCVSKLVNARPTVRLLKGTNGGRAVIVTIDRLTEVLGNAIDATARRVAGCPYTYSVAKISSLNLIRHQLKILTQ